MVFPFVICSDTCSFVISLTGFREFFNSPLSLFCITVKINFSQRFLTGYNIFSMSPNSVKTEFSLLIGQFLLLRNFFFRCLGKWRLSTILSSWINQDFNFSRSRLDTQISNRNFLFGNITIFPSRSQILSSLNKFLRYSCPALCGFLSTRFFARSPNLFPL